MSRAAMPARRDYGAAWGQRITKSGMAMLWGNGRMLTKDPRYLRLAEEIAARAHRYPKQHSHGFLASVRGVVDSGNLLVQGAVGETFAPIIRCTEGCSEAGWLHLTLSLWRLTAQRESPGANALQRVRHESIQHRRFRRPSRHCHRHADWHGPGRRLHGLRAFLEILANVFRADAGALCHDPPVDGCGKIDGLAVWPARALAVREPSWAGKIAVLLNGSPQAPKRRDGYLCVIASWKTGDTVLLKYHLRTRAERDLKTTLPRAELAASFARSGARSTAEITGRVAGE